jgi:phospholipase/carboxylesterase
MPEPAWEQLPRARADLRRRLEALGQDIPLTRTALLGFSQGAAMALDAATDARLGVLPLAGLVGCSGYPHPDWQPAAPLPPVLLTHGEQDPVVNPAYGAELLRRLQATGAMASRLRQLTFPGGHGIDPALLPAIRAFLEDVLASG